MNAPLHTAALMSGQDFRESLRRYRPTVYVDGRQVDSVADERAFQPGINAIALTYDYALKARLADVLRANPDVPYEQRIETARFIKDLTAGYQGGRYSTISLHGGGSPAAMKQEIYRNYPVGSKVELVERILERGVGADGSPTAAPHDPRRPITRNRQPGKCCDTGCTTPGQPVMVDLPLPHGGADRSR